MKHVLLAASFVLLLTGCGGGTATVEYDVSFPTTDNPDRMAALTLATRNVMERRLARLGSSIIDYDIEHDKEEGTTVISVEIDDKDAAKKMNEEMLSPFSFEFRALVEQAQEGDIEVEGVGAFRSTGIGMADIDWVLGETLEGPLKKGAVVIGFTDEGMERVKEIFPEYVEQTVGIFVRDRLTASITLSEDQIGRTVIIGGIPNGEIAKVFADDMNTGIHMLFAPHN